MLSLTPLHATPFWRTAAVVRDRGYIFDERHFQSGGLQRTNRRFTPRSGALHQHFGALHPVFDRFTRRRFGGHLRCEWRRFFRALETEITGRGPRNDVSVTVGNRYDRVIERRMHVSDARMDVFNFTFFTRFGLFLGSQTKAPLLLYLSPNAGVSSPRPAEPISHRTLGDCVRARATREGVCGRCRVRR
uniref:Uncharacterized protein n=1 Tax=mine drainage metagenome TaxID=410659 RepID=E6Q8B0_9ZZZZ